MKKAKAYAQKQQISLSKLVEKLFSTLEVKQQESGLPSPIVGELSGIVNKKLSIDPKKAREIRLIKKFL